MKNLKPVYIVGSKRTPFVKSMTHYMGVSTQDLMTVPVKALVEQFSLQSKQVGDVALGAVMNSSSNWNLAREVVLGSGLSPSTPAYNVQRACGTGLETAWQIALKIGAGQIENGIAGGVDTNSDIPIEVSSGFKNWLLNLNNQKTVLGRVLAILKFRLRFLKPKVPAVVEPRTGLSMGQHTEKMVQEWKISRASQDELALRSHLAGEKAYLDGFYKDLVVETKGLNKDATLRGDTTLEKLQKLKPAFEKSEKGTLTAGNSSPLTDGAACVLLASAESCQTNNWKPLAKLVDVEVAALDYVAGEGLLMAPAKAVSNLLLRNSLTLQDFDYYEIHEAFAGQVLCTLKAWESQEYSRKYLGRNEALGSIDQSKMNLFGGSVALGHPFAVTGARILGSISQQISVKKGRALISICTAGGMGIAAIVEGV